MIADGKTVHNHVEPSTSPTTKTHMETRTKPALAATINSYFKQQYLIMNIKRGHLSFGLTAMPAQINPEAKKIYSVMGLEATTTAYPLY